MSAALGAAGLATPVAARMMVVGERSGDMGHMLAQIARFHDDEVARTIDVVHQGVRAGADGGARPRHRRRGGPHVHADLRARREHPLMVIENIAELSAKLRMPAIDPGGDARSSRRVRPDPLLRGRAPRLRRAARRRRRGRRWCWATRSTSTRRTGSRSASPRRSATAWRAARTSRPISRSRKPACAPWTGCRRIVAGKYLHARAGNLVRGRGRSRQHGGQAGQLDPVRRAQGRRERRAPRVDRAAA